MKYKFNKKIIITFCFFIFSTFLYSQDKIIAGTILDSLSNERLPYASIIIKNDKDSVIKFIYSNEIGRFSISYPENTQGNIYFDMLGYKTKKFNLTEFKNQFNEFNFLLKPKTEIINEVVVKGEKENVIKKIDRDVYNITKERKKNANDIYDILETLPGVIIDKQNNTIRFKGGSPEVLVDNMPASFIYPKLQMISIDDIEIIELIDRSSLYGGEGKGGIINVKLKKQKIDAFGAYVSTEYDYTPNDKQFSLGDNFLNLNYLTKFGLIFNNLNYKKNNEINTYQTNGSILSNNINYDKKDNSISNIDKINLTDYCGIYLPSNNFSFLYAFGYKNNNLNKYQDLKQQVFKNNIDYNYNMTERGSNIRNAQSLYHLAKLFINTKKFEFSISYTNSNVKGNSEINNDILYFGNFDSTYNYSTYENVKNKTNYITSYLNYSLNTTSKLNFHFSYLNDQYPENTFSYILNGSKYLPLYKSDIKGIVNSTYGIGYAKRFGRFTVDATINYKYDKINGNYIRYIANTDTNLIVDINNHFINPSIRFKKSLNKHNDFYLGYNYTNNLGNSDNYLAFIDKQNPNVWYSGNSDLESEYYHNAYFSYKLTKDSLSFSTEIFYKTTLNGISNIHYPLSPQLTIVKPENIAQNQKIGTDISIWYMYNEKISFTLNSIISYNLFNTGELSLNNDVIERKQLNSLIKFLGTYHIDKKMGTYIWINYYPTEIYYYGTMQKPLFAAIAISRKFFNDKLFINISVGNLFTNISTKQSTENYMGVKTNTNYSFTEDKFRLGWYIYYVFKSGDKGTKGIKID